MHGWDTSMTFPIINPRENLSMTFASIFSIFTGI